MKDESKTKIQLIQELELMRRRVAELEAEKTALGMSLPDEFSSQEEMKFQTIFETAAIGIALVDMEGRPLVSNPALQKMLGYSAEELRKMVFTEFTHPEDAGRDMGLYKELLAGKRNEYRVEKRYIHRNGQIIWGNLTVSLVRNPDGSPRFAIGMAENITERKRAEEELKQRAVQLALINDIGRQIAAVLDLDNVLNRAARLVQEAFNYHHVALFLIDEGEAVLRLKAVAGSYEPYFPPGHTQRLSEGINGWVATHGEKIVANDISAETRYTSLIAEHTITQAELCLPIKIANHPVGILDIQSPQLNIFDDANIFAMEILTDQIAVAIANARFYETTKLEISQRQRAEEALRESEARFRQFLGSVSSHIYVWEVREDGRRINHYISPNVEALTGYGYNNFINDWSFWPSVVIHPADRAVAAAQADRLALGQNSEVEYRMVRADGQTIWVRDSGRVDIDKSSKMIYGVVNDITERKKAEEELQAERVSLARRVEERTVELRVANAELARAARLKDEFLANMSHELRTPLNAILGMSEVLRSEVYGSLNEEQSNALKHIENSGQHLLALINDILDLSKIEANKLELLLGPVLITELCQTSLFFIKQMALKKQIQVFFDPDPTVDKLQADQRRLKQILVNLLSNAVKFTPEGGQIGLEIVGNQAKQIVHFIVWDTGIGIPHEIMDTLFQPFVQIDSSLSRQYEGTGLGLSLVSRLADLHGGGVSVESEVGQGSRFTVSLPWRNDDSLTEPAMTPLSSPAQSAKTPRTNNTEEKLILLAEDNATNRVIIRDYLQHHGYRVVEAYNGVSAIEQAQEQQPDVILMDIQMPVMNGLEAIRQIKANPKLAVTPIIAITALAMPGDKEKCLQAGANNYLSKPLDLAKLVMVIEAELQNSTEFEPS
jgi:PAS domain S-box-containing protein